MNRGSRFMHASRSRHCQLIYLTFISILHCTKAGVCWDTIDDSNGTCHRGFHTNMTLHECCAIKGKASIAWSPHSHPSEVFILNYMSPLGAPKCQRCHSNCGTVKCLPGRVCRMVNGFPVCVCRPKCDLSLKKLGAVCGSDGRKYKNYCTLLRKNCKEHRSVAVEYFGRCRRSCKKVRCQQGKRCLEDQNGHPHCWACDTTCNRYIPDDPRNYFCAVNGKTYKNTCELKAEICKVGRSIMFAYHGMCRENATCLATTCPRRYTCLKNPLNGQPVCMNCHDIKMYCSSSNHLSLCGTDGRTYSSYCELRKRSCARGILVSVKRAGKCKRKQRHRKNGWRKRPQKKKKAKDKKKTKKKGGKKQNKQRRRKIHENRRKKSGRKGFEKHTDVKARQKDNRPPTNHMNQTLERHSGTHHSLSTIVSDST